MRTLVISDVHGDARSLERVLVDADDRGWDRMTFLGDAVGYGSDVSDAVTMLRAARPHRAIRGNHEVMMARLHAGEIPRAHPAWLEDLERHRRALSDDDLAWLLELPDVATTDAAEPWGTFDLVHAHPSPDRPLDYLLSPVDARKAEKHLVHDVTLFGHTHVPGGFVHVDGRWRGIAARAAETTVALPVGTRVLLNPGSVGKARDGGPSACYLLLDGEAREATFVRLGS